jgi:hypothetical protein
MTGTGKSTVLERLAKAFEGDHVVIYDWHYAEFAEQRFNIPPVSTFTELGEAIDRGDKIICYSNIDVLAEPEIYFPEFCQFMLECSMLTTKHWLVEIDEIGQWLNHSKIDREIKNLVVAGRKFGVDMAYGFHQLNEIHFTLRQHLSEVFFFRHGDDLAMRHPADMGMSAEELQSLPDTHYIYYDKKSQKKIFDCLYANSDSCIEPKAEKEADCYSETLEAETGE